MQLQTFIRVILVVLEIVFFLYLKHEKVFICLSNKMEMSLITHLQNKLTKKLNNDIKWYWGQSIELLSCKQKKYRKVEMEWSHLKLSVCYLKHYYIPSQHSIRHIAFVGSNFNLSRNWYHTFTTWFWLGICIKYTDLLIRLFLYIYKCKETMF